tara:strand:- start:996 stop:2363 length:1368 start_codon:yes stop_codon:yes gene_type:complete
MGGIFGDWWEDHIAPLNPMRYDSYWDRAAGGVEDFFRGADDKIEEWDNWLNQSYPNQLLNRAWERSGPFKWFYDEAIDPWVNVLGAVGSPQGRHELLDSVIGDPVESLISGAKNDLRYIFTGVDQDAVDAYREGREGGYAGYERMNPLHPENQALLQNRTPEVPDEEDFEDDTGSGVGDLYARLAEMQRAEARRGAEAATAFVDEEYERLLSDYARWEADRQATTGTQGEINKARLDESLEYIGVNTSEALSTLADIGIDAEESARAVGGEIGASLYGIYNSGAQLIDNLDRIASDTLDEQRSASASDYASGLFQIKENLANQLAEIDQGMMMYQIQAAEAAAAAEQAVRESEQKAQLYMNYASYLAEVSKARGGQMQDDMEIFISLMLGDWKPEYTFPDVSVDDFAYGTWTAKDMQHPIFQNLMTKDQIDERILELAEAGYFGTGSLPPTPPQP